MKRILFLPALLFPMLSFAVANDSTHVQLASKLLGRPLVVSQAMDPLSSGQGVQSQTALQMFGKSKILSLFNLLTGSRTSSNTPHLQHQLVYWRHPCVDRKFGSKRKHLQL